MYRVLVQTERGLWESLGEYAAGSTDGAIRAAGKTLDLHDREVVAVPSKSWKPIKVTVKPREPQMILGSPAEPAPVGGPETTIVDEREVGT